MSSEPGPESAAQQQPSEPESSAAETVGRTAGLLAKLMVRGALRSKTIRDQVRDVQVEANRPLPPLGPEK